MKVLLLEDEQSIRDFVRINLKRQGYEVYEAATGEEALRIVQTHSDVEIAILDVMLPGISGLEVCQELRRQYPRMGIIMLTAKGQETDKVMGLEYGADDYVVKPFSPTELMARVKSLARRLHASDPKTQEESPLKQEMGPFILSIDQQRLYKTDREILLTPTELQIVRLFWDNPNKAISRDEILNQVWGKHYVGDLKVVDVNMRRLRQKIEDDPSHPQFIETVWGYGYLWRKD
ncbi:response regulator transcription factor [Brevibacillus ginsengisoli]|uniref:response regulator transcription factor n=1 Tax=Brevibacillus ginsengisoli TaxID=363854 RepID=UPI003CE929B8